MQLARKRLWPQILIALSITGVASGIVINATWEDDSWVALSSLDIRFVVAAFGLLVAAWCVDAFRMNAMIRALGYKISPWILLRTNFMGYFLSAITPFTAGGGPLQVYSLARAGLTIGHGTAAVLVSGFVAQFGLAMAGIAIVFGFDIPISADPRLDQLAHSGVVVYAAVIVTLVWLTWHIDKGRRLIAGVVRGVLRFVVSGRKVRKAAVVVDRTIVEMHRGLREIFGRRSTWAIVAAGASVVYYAVQFAIVPVLALGLGVSVSIPLLIAVQVPIVLLASILPTPGGSGGLEFGLASALMQQIPPAQVGIIIVAWRLLTFYCVIAAGGTVSLAFVRSELGRAAAAREESATERDEPAAARTPVAVVDEGEVAIGVPALKSQPNGVVNETKRAARTVNSTPTVSNVRSDR